MVDFWWAIPPVLITIVIIYFSLFKFLKLLCREHFGWFVASIIFLSPFGFVLLEARSLLEIMWMLLLTPFYAVIVLSLSTVWVVRFYCMAFATLLIAQFLLQKGNPQNELQSEGRFEMFLATHLKRRIYGAARGETLAYKITRKVHIFTRSLGKLCLLLLSICLLVTLTATFASSVSPRNPTYVEVQQFVTSDKTCRHPYVEGSYTCANFAGDFRNNALSAGYECGYVFAYFPDAQSHALNCFNTTDEGLVFVEPQMDKLVNVTVGEPYRCGNLTLPVQNNTVLWYSIDWQTSSMIP
jgi:hypothetical protein